MYQTLIPLDIIWMDSNRNIVEMVENAPALQDAGEQVPEIWRQTDLGLRAARSEAAWSKKYGLQVGQTDPVVMPSGIRRLLPSS